MDAHINLLTNVIWFGKGLARASMVISMLLVSQFYKEARCLANAIYSISFKLRAVAVVEAQSYLFPSVASGCFKL